MWNPSFIAFNIPPPPLITLRRCHTPLTLISTLMLNCSASFLTKCTANAVTLTTLPSLSMKRLPAWSLNWWPVSLTDKGSLLVRTLRNRPSSRVWSLPPLLKLLLLTSLFQLRVRNRWTRLLGRSVEGRRNQLKLVPRCLSSLRRLCRPFVMVLKPYHHNRSKMVSRLSSNFPAEVTLCLSPLAQWT